jgi:prophage DNA circulation protein
MFGITAVIRIVAILAIVAIGAGGIWYVTGLRADLAVSQENTKKMEAAVELQNQVIQQMQADQKKIQELNQQLTETVKSQQKDMQALSDRFTTNADGSKRDLGEIAIQKPDSIERAINKGTKNALRCIEIASGAPLTEQEQNATKADEINKECPALANPRYKPVTVN